MRELRIEVRETRVELRREIDDLRMLLLRIGGGMLIAQFGMIAALIARG